MPKVAVYVSGNGLTEKSAKYLLEDLISDVSAGCLPCIQVSLTPMKGKKYTKVLLNIEEVELFK